MNKERFKHILLAIIYWINNLFFWLTQVKLLTYIRYGGKIWLYRKAHLKLHRSCQLKIAEKSYLRIGASWEPIGHNFYTAFFDTHFVAYKNSYIEIGDKVRIHTGCLFRIQSNGKLIIGNNILFNSFGMVYCYDMIKIGNDVVIGPYVRIRDSDSHHFEYPGIIN